MKLHCRRVPLLCAFFLPLFAPPPLVARQTAGDVEENSPEGVVRALYDLCTFPAETTPGWDEMRAMFIPESVIVIRTSRAANSVFTLEGFVQDWLHFIESDNVEATGFEERIVRLHATELAALEVLREGG